MTPRQDPDPDPGSEWEGLTSPASQCSTSVEQKMMLKEERDKHERAKQREQQRQSLLDLAAPLHTSRRRCTALWPNPSRAVNSG